jgi:hypothetical protein
MHGDAMLRVRKGGFRSSRPHEPISPEPMAAEEVTLKLTARQAEALRALAALEELPPEVYAAEVLVKHLYHAYTPQVAARAAGTPPAGPA